MDCDVSPVDQSHEVPFEAVRVTESPAQKVVEPDGVMVAAGLSFTTTEVAALVVEQPAALLTVTL